MRTFFILLTLVLAVSVSAQTKIGAGSINISKNSKYGTVTLPSHTNDSILKKITATGNMSRFYKVFPDTLVIGDTTLPIDNMPNAFTPKQFPSVYKNNNGRGFDVYESTLDGMPILMPDSSNKSSLINGMVRRPNGIRMFVIPQTKNNKYPKN